jgi:hypothetical protein
LDLPGGAVLLSTLRLNSQRRLPLKSNFLKVVFCLLVLSICSYAQFDGFCTPAGIWYGGSDYKYILTITPTAPNVFAIRSEGVYDQAAFGYHGWTSLSGNLVQVKYRTYISQSIAIYTTSPDMVPSPDTLELDVVHSKIELTDCDTLKNTIDLFGAYFDLSKTPFVDPPDLSYIPPGQTTIVETYRRMPSLCKVCETWWNPPHGWRKRH